jgi:hypothetical protein
MGTSFFKQKEPAMTGSNINQLARAEGTGAYASRSAAIGQQKALAGALKANASVPHGPLKNSAAYPKGPKT